ncbi:MAG TPA: lysophospholipid acyltransferase family protein [Longimicrobiaceae bacterium]|nr:lysophospholipid acyltransferase family protein [Longimicrobiaceae bacterium]
MFYLRVALSLAGFLAASIYGVAIAVLRRDKRCVAHDYAQMMVRLMRPPLGLKVEVEGREKLSQTRPCIYIANHQSAYDVPVLAELYLPDTVVIGKKELANIPFFGWLYRVTGNIMIDRKDTERAVGRLREAEEAVRTRGVSIWIFPEGTRGKVAGELLPFKKGAFYMAIATGIPLVPVVVAPLRGLFNLEERELHSGTVHVRVLDGIPTAGLTDADLASLIDTARTRMSNALRDLAEKQTTQR